MNKLAALLLPVMITIGSLAAQVQAAVVIPAKKGYVQDTAGMLQKQKVAEIEKAADGKPYRFYILTVDSFKGEKPDAYAAELYKQWKLQSGDIALLLSNGDKRIEMYFNNKGLADALETLPADYDGDGNKTESKLDELVGKHFTPNAKQGDFAKGVLELIAKTESLGQSAPKTGTAASSGETKPQAGASAPASTPQNEGTAPKEGAVAGQSGASAGQTAKASGKGGAGTTIGIVAVALLAICSAIRLVMLKKQRSRKEAAIQSCNQLLAKLNSAREELEPIALLYEGGSTKRETGRLNNEIDSGLERAVNLQQRLEEVGVSFLRTGASRSLTALEAEAAGLLTEVEAVSAGVKRLTELDQTIRRTIHQLEQDAAAAQTEAGEQSRARNMPLEALFRELAGIEQAAQRLAELHMTDLVRAEQELNPVNEKMQLLRGLLERLPDMIAEAESAPGRIGQTRQHVVQFMRDHALKKAEAFDPVRDIVEADEANESLPDALNEGRLVDASGGLELIRDRLARAVGESEKRAELKRSVLSRLQQLDERIRGLDFSEAQYKERLARTQEEFTRSAWASVPEKRADLKRAMDEVRSEQEASKEGAGGAQLYSDADARLTRAAALMEEAERNAAICMNVYEEASSRLSELKSRARLAWNRCEEAGRFADSESLPDSSVQAYASPVSAAKPELDRLLRVTPRDLERIASLLQSFEEDAQAYEHAVRRIADEKHEAESRMRDIQSKYRSANGRVSAKLKTNKFSSGYSSHMSDVQHLLSIGLYADAISRMSDAENSIRQMEAAYEETVRREEEQQRQEEESRRSTASSGGDSWGGSSDSGSGSNSGSDNKGGGDSW